MIFGAQFIKVLQESLTHLVDDTSRMIHEHNGQPSDGSQMVRELASFSPAELIHSACYLGTTLLDFGGEHVSAFVRMLDEPVEILASWTCVRSMLESSSLAAWLLDPAIDARTRVGRVFTLRYEEMEQQAKFLRAVGNDPALLQKQIDRIDAVEKNVLGLGYPRATDKKGNRIGFVEKMPSATQMIKMMLNDEWSYRLLSAVAHGHSWAIRGLGWTSFGPDVTVGGVQLKQFEKTVNPDAIAIMGLSAAKALARPAWNQSRYFGWDEEPWKAVFEHVFDTLGASDNQRFWRT